MDDQAAMLLCEECRDVRQQPCATCRELLEAEGVLEGQNENR